jgi:Flp pilus assembly protein CpaB
VDTTTKILFGVGAVLAVLVGVAVYVLVTAAYGQGLTATTSVVVARVDIPERTLFTASNVPDLLATRQLPSEAVPLGALRGVVDAVGKATLQPLLAGEIVMNTPDRLASGEGFTARPSAAIPRDKVALAITAGESVSVAGALLPGDRVDIIATWTAPGEETIAQTIFPDVRVFAVGPWQGSNRGRSASAAVAGAVSPSPPPPATTVTLLLDNQQAVITQYLLQTGGHIALALRRFDQGIDIPTEPVTAEALTRRVLGAPPGGAATSLPPTSVPSPTAAP